jgi:hypothetical protein
MSKPKHLRRVVHAALAGQPIPQLSRRAVQAMMSPEQLESQAVKERVIYLEALRDIRNWIHGCTCPTCAHTRFMIASALERGEEAAVS